MQHNHLKCSRLICIYIFSALFVYNTLSNFRTAFPSHAHFICVTRTSTNQRRESLYHSTALCWPVSARVSTKAARSRRQLHSLQPEASCSFYITQQRLGEKQHISSEPGQNRSDYRFSFRSVVKSQRALISLYLMYSTKKVA